MTRNEWKIDRLVEILRDIAAQAAVLYETHAMPSLAALQDIALEGVRIGEGRERPAEASIPDLGVPAEPEDGGPDPNCLHDHIEISEEGTMICPDCGAEFVRASEGPPYDAATRTGMYDHD